MLHLTFVTLLALTKSQVTGPPFTCPSVSSPVPPNDCNCNYEQCTWSGDPHQTTFDNFHYHFQGALGQTYRYVSSCTSNEEQVPFQVLATHGSCPSSNPGVTCTTQVQVRLYDRTTGAYDRIITIDPGFNVDDSTLTPPVAVNDVNFYANGNSFYSRPADNRLEFFTRQLCTDDLSQQFQKPDLVVEDISGVLSLRNMRVEINDFYVGMVCGLCGYYDQDGTGGLNDFLYPAIATATTYDQCLERVPPSTSSMSSYTPTDWYNVDTFGAAWIDFGPGIRRRALLQEEQEIEHPQNDPARRRKALIYAVELFREEAETQEFFLDDCADDGQFICEDITMDCIFDVCQQLIPSGPSDTSC